MKKRDSIPISFVIIIIFVGVDVTRALDQSLWIEPDDEEPAVILEKALADFDPPRTPFSLKELVESLIAVTDPEADDSDNDTIPDPVEAVIGTDPLENDSDCDYLNDSYEVWNGLDPLEPDSNFDGLPDYIEVTNVSSQDIDLDGVVNAWDFDNDGDGVNDYVDLSPFFKSITMDSAHFDVITNENPTYVTFQIRPGNPEHLKLFYQSWDWPYDEDGSMKDLDRSEDDLYIIPVLNLTTDDTLDHTELIKYGTIPSSTGVYVQLYPTMDYDDITAFTGRMVYPGSVSHNWSFNLELTWKVYGQSDEYAVAWNTTNGKCVTVGSDGIVVVNASEITATETFWYIDLGDEDIALKAANGMYWSVANDGKIYANGTDIGDRETFEAVNLYGHVWLMSAYIDKFIVVSPDGTLIAQSGDEVGGEAFLQIDMGVKPETTLLVTYHEPFTFTGFAAEEYYESNVGLFYSDDINKTMQANLLLDCLYLKNTTTNVANIFDILVQYDLYLANQTGTFSHNDEAMNAISNDMVPKALNDLPRDKPYPIILTQDNRFSSLEMGQFDTASPFTLDLTSVPIIASKTMKTEWYNSSLEGDNADYDVLTIEDIENEIYNWQLPESLYSTLLTLTMYWTTGQQQITHVGEEEVEIDGPGQGFLDAFHSEFDNGVLAISIIQGYEEMFRLYFPEAKIVKKTLEGIKKISPKSFRAAAKKVVNLLRATRITKVGKVVSKTGKGFGKLIVKGLDSLGKAAALLDVGIAVYSVVTIATSGLGPLEMYHELMKTVMNLVYNLLLFALGEIPVWGWLIAALIIISDMLFGWSDKFFEWLISQFIDVTNQATPSMDFVGDPIINIDDYDNNGLDVGDRITYRSRMLGKVSSTDEKLADYSGVWPHLSIISPPGSNSLTGYVYQNTSIWYVPVQPSSQWQHTNGWDGDVRWFAQEYEVGAWIEPGIAMPNFPVTIQVDATYNLWYSYETLFFIVFYWKWVEHNLWKDGDTRNDQPLGEFTLKFDVLPGSIDDFVKWRSIKSNDQDGDGLKNKDEKGISDPWKYDTDADGVNDKFEYDIGTNPKHHDTDYDGLTDEYELVYGVNGSDPDHDGDGLSDYLEVAGWIINFNYSEQPFSMRVFSNPKVADSDGDGVDDLNEYYSNLNPRSNDSNGDGVYDVSGPRAITHTEYQNQLNFSLGVEHHTYAIRTDACGDVYLTHTDNGSISKFYENLTHVDLPDNSSFPNPAWEAKELAVDDSNGWIYAGESIYAGGYDISYGIFRYNLDGSNETGPYAVKTGVGTTMSIHDMDVDSEGNLYVSRSSYIEKYSPNMTLLYTLGPFSTSYKMQIDDKHGYIYTANHGEIQKWNLNDGSYIRAISGISTDAITVDGNGFLYVVDNNERVRKFDSNCLEDTNFTLTNLTYPQDMTVDSDGNIFIVDAVGGTAETWDYAIIKYSQEIEYLSSTIPDTVTDWDLDGLENEFETTGWEITFENETGVFSLNVTTDPLLNDTDFDGLSDFQEYTLGSDPTNPDTDSDGQSDYDEWVHELVPPSIATRSNRYFTASIYHNFFLSWEPKSNLTCYDTDHDNLSDGVEYTYGSSLTNNDTDGEGLSDFTEFLLNSSPIDADTDMDGLSDAIEIVFNSSLLTADSDGDFMFDGLEYGMGTNPLSNDTDNDNITDGTEVLLQTNPLSNDTDGDNVTDGMEIELHTNPRDNDTDGDGFSDSEEIKLGSNPTSNMSTTKYLFDGTLPQIVLAYDNDTEPEKFILNLARYANITIVSIEELLESYTDAKNIVLIGEPREGNETVGNLIYDLLDDTGDVLTNMIVSDANRLAVRYGVWHDTQTVVMLSHAYPMDCYKVLDVLRSKNVTINPFSISVVYPTIVVPESAQYTYNVYFGLNEIDTVKQTDTIIYIMIDESVSPNVEISQLDATTVTTALTNETGLVGYDKSVDKYIEIDVSFESGTADAITGVLIRIYYRPSDLDNTGDGFGGSFGDFNETTLNLYYFDDATDTWILLTNDLEWVLEIGVNTSDIELYGEQYAGYVYAYVKHLSLFGLGGSLYGQETTPSTTPTETDLSWLWDLIQTYWMYIAGAVLAILVIFALKRRRK